MRRRQAGFTLMEVLVALVILGLALGAVMEAVSGSLAGREGARAMAEAVAFARSRLAEALAQPGLLAGHLAWQDGPFSWSRTVLPRAEVGPLTLWQVEIEVSHGGRQVRLTSLSLGAR